MGKKQGNAINSLVPAEQLNTSNAQEYHETQTIAVPVSDCAEDGES